MRSGPFISFNVAGKLFADTGTKHFDGNILAFGRPRAVDLRDRRGANRHRIDIFEQSGRWLIQAGVDLRIDKVEGRRGQLVLKHQQIVHGFFSNDVGPCRKCLPKLNRRRANGPKRPGIIGRFGLDRAKSRNTKKALYLRRGVAISLNGAQRSVAREDAAPFEQAKNMCNWTGHLVRGYTFQPLCIATSPPNMGSTLVCTKPASPIMRLKFCISGKRRMDSTR